MNGAIKQNSARRKPDWLKVRVPGGATFSKIRSERQQRTLATVCEEARCPNIGECWEAGTATFMVLGDTCTRHCRFCSVKTGNPQGRTDASEPEKIAEVIRSLDLSYVVLTMVDRDDLDDGGSAHVVRCVNEVKARSEDIKVEILMGDFRARRDLLHPMARSSADVLAHNVETVESLSKQVRDGKCSYVQSLETLTILKEEAPEKLTKSSIMLGLGESEEEVRSTLRDLLTAGVQIVTLGQYLQPTQRHLPVTEYIHPDRFAAWKSEAESMGFLFCFSGPLVRSSYKAGESFTEHWLREQTVPQATVEDHHIPGMEV